MYVREKKVRRGETTYSYWQVVQGTRVDGKVRQTVVAHLGPAKDRDQADRRARFKGILCGVWRCGRAGAVELTWRSWGGATSPVKMSAPFMGKRYGYLVCPDHLEEWHSRQADGTLEEFPRILPHVPE